MIRLNSASGIRIHGASAAKWMQPATRAIGGTIAQFDKDIYEPRVLTGNKPRFGLPCNRDADGYDIHLLETGDAVIFRRGYVYTCTFHEGKPRVLKYVLDKPTQEHTQLKTTNQL